MRSVPLREYAPFLVKTKQPSLCQVALTSVFPRRQGGQDDGCPGRARQRRDSLGVIGVLARRSENAIYPGIYQPGLGRG